MSAPLPLRPAPWVMIFVALTILGGLLDPGSPLSAQGQTARRQRTFSFTYQATIHDVPEGKVARIWLPVPPSNSEQDVRMTAQDLPGTPRLAREPEYGNQVMFVEAKADAGKAIPLSLTYRVTRREVRGEDASARIDADLLARFLRPDAKVAITGKPLELIRDKRLPAEPMAAARMLYDVVNGHMRYSKEGSGWGQGDAAWACASGYGNCSDFHSLFISLARSQQIPAKFEIGFPLPEKRGQGELAGYHCWAKFRAPGRGWIPVDISEANKNPKLLDYYFGNLSEDRITFSVGRDLELVPKQAAKPLNFFVYPYVEVDGVVYPDEKIERRFSFRDEE